MKILIFRSCRPPQFAAALTEVRRQHPGAEVWACGHERFRDELLAAGVEHVIGHDATRFTVLRLGLGMIRRLRAVEADLVVLPLMDDNLVLAANLLRVAAAVNPPAVAVCPGGGALLRLERRGLRRLAIATTLKAPESLVILAQMLHAWATPRRPAREIRPGDRRRVLHIINSLGMGGAQTQFVELLNRTPPTGFTVNVLVLSNEQAFMGQRLLRDDVTVHQLERQAQLETPIDAIARVCRTGAYDIVHTWLPQANMWGSAAARLAGVPRVITSVRSLNPGRYPQWCQWWYRPADVIAARLASVVTVNARPLARDHGRWAFWPHHRIAVVHNGLDVPLAPPDSRARLRAEVGVEAGVPIVGTVGRLASEKDHETFIRALWMLHGQGLRCHGVIAGEGPCEPALRALVARLGLSALVTFLGARSDAHEVIAGFDLFVLTSTIEGFPNVLLEAALLGVPLVSSDVGGVRDLVTEPDALFPSRNPVAAAVVMREALRHPAIAVERAARLQARCCQQFTAARMVERWLSLYDPPAYREATPEPLPQADPRLAA